MVGRWLFVEGGGDSKALRTAAREGFRKLLEKGGLGRKMPRIVASGTRMAAYEAFRAEMGHENRNDRVFLLVDSEEPLAGDSTPSEEKAWRWVQKERVGDHWRYRPGATHGDHLHLMVPTMEAWLLSDRTALKSYFGNKLSESALPRPGSPVEQLAKASIYESLNRAAKDTPKASYMKGRDSFQLLAKIDPSKLAKECPWARRFFETLNRLL